MTKIWLKIELKRAVVMLPVILKRAVLLLLALGLAAGAAAFCVVTAGRESDDSRIRIGYAAADNVLTDMVVSYAQEIESVKALCSIERVSREEGFQLLQEGELSVLAVLPDDIAGEILSGKNTPASVYVKEDNTVKNLLFRELADAAVGMLQTAQAEIYAVSYVLDDAVLADDALVQKLYDDINRFNLGLAAGRENLFKLKTVSVTGNDTYVIYYGSAILTIYMLFAGAFFGNFFCHSAVRRNMLEKRLHVSRPRQVLCGFSTGLLPMAVVTILPFGALAVSFVRERVFVDFSWGMVCLLILIAVFHVLYFQLIYQILGEKRSTLLAIGMLAAIQGYLSGCMVPSALLPNLVYDAGQYLPAAFLKRAFTVILSGDLQKLSLAVPGLLAWSFVLFAANYIWTYADVLRKDGTSKETAFNGKKTVHVPPDAWVIFKRMLFKKGILVILALMAAGSVLTARLERKSDTAFEAAVYDESGEYEDLFSAQESLVRFCLCGSADEVETLVLKDEAECGYILPKDFTKNMLAGRAGRTITVYEDSDSLYVPLVNEVMFHVIFRHVSLEWYQNYLSVLHADAALTAKAFADQIALGKTFGIEFVTVGDNGTMTVDTGGHQTYPAVFVVAAAVLLCGIQGALTAAGDHRKGRFYKRGRAKLTAFTIMLPMLTATAAGIVLLLFLYGAA